MTRRCHETGRKCWPLHERTHEPLTARLNTGSSRGPLKWLTDQPAAALQGQGGIHPSFTIITGAQTARD